MQNVNLYDYYGISVPMLLVASDEVVQEIINCASSWSSLRMLNALYLEGRILQHELYQSGRFKFYVDEASPKVKNLIKFTDFYVAYKKYVQSLLTEVTRPGVPSSRNSLRSPDAIVGSEVESPLDGLDAIVSSEVESPLDGLDAIVSSEVDSPLDGLADSPMQDVGSATLDSIAVDDLPLNLVEDAQYLDQLATEISESDQPDQSLDDMLGSESSNLNSRLLEELALNHALDRAVNDCDYSVVLRYITNWAPQVFKSLRDINVRKDRETFETMQKTADSLKESIKKLQENSSSELSQMRISVLQQELSTKEELIEQNKARLEFFDERLQSVIQAELKNLPQNLKETCMTLNKEMYVLKGKEYTILSGLHKYCTMPTNGIARLEWLLGLIERKLRMGTSETRKFLNADYATLTTKDTKSRLILFNRKYKEYLRKFTGPDLLQVLDEGLADCAALLSADSSTDRLTELFVQAPGEARSTLRGTASLSLAVEVIMGNSQLMSRMQLGKETVSKESLTSLLSKFVQSMRILDLAANEEVLVQIYKLWQFVNKYSVQNVLNIFGVFEAADMQMLRCIQTRLGIPGLYINSVAIFWDTCKVGLNAPSGKSITIHKASKPNCWDNLAVIQKYLISSKAMLSGGFATVEF